MKFLIVLTAFVAVATSWSIPSEGELANHWQRFKAEHGKNYANEIDETYRMKIFKENAIKVAKHNARFDAGEVTYTVAINKFADLHTHEVAERLNGYRSPVNKPVRAMHNVSEPVGWSWPWNWNKSVDWREKGYVTEVKDQGNCAASWAFSATGSLEGALYKKNKELVILSEQNLIDCTDGNDCNSGHMDSAFASIRDNGGIATEESYPYLAADSLACVYAKEHSAGTLTNFVDIKQFSESDLKDAVNKVGPVSVAINAITWDFQMYQGGILYDPSCSSTDLDHAVLVVGYGSEGHKKDYWIVKNSWGADWGDNGYIKMARNQNNNCGIATEASYPVV